MRRGPAAAPVRTKPSSIRFLQVNVDRKRATHDVVARRARKGRMDVLLLGEPNKRLCAENSWLTDNRSDAAIVVPNGDVTVHDTGRGDGFVWAELSGLFVYSCYCSPNVGQQRFEEFLTGLDRDVRRKGRQVIIIGGDFNAKAAEWGSPVEDGRGAAMTEWLSGANMVVMNRGGRPTFVRNDQTSCIDVTICSEDASRRLLKWRVTDEETLGCHRIIEYEYSGGAVIAVGRSNAGWRVNDKTLQTFREKFATRVESELRGADRTNYDRYLQTVIDCCNDAFPKRKTNPGGKSEVYWWCEELRLKRRACLRSRRELTRANRRGDAARKTEAAGHYKTIRREYNHAILRAKKKSWRDMLNDLDRDEWGQGYRIIIKITNMKSLYRLSEERQLIEARKLFPVVMDDVGVGRTPVDRPKKFTIEELERALRKIKNRKAPRPDGILPEVAKAAVLCSCDLFLEIANRSLVDGCFPGGMKEGRLALIPKPCKDKDQPKTYRPISLLGVFGKILEAMIEQRLKEELLVRGELHERQYGFRTGRSAVDAIMEVVGVARRAVDAAAQHKKLCALVALDVRNAFNSVRWSSILGALEGRGVDSHLIRIVRSYLTGRTLIVGEGGRMDLSCGVPQGSVLGPLLWNIFYDDVLAVGVPAGRRSSATRTTWR